MILAMLRPIAWSALALLLPVVGARAEETLQAPGLQERVKVERTQFEVIVWPPKDDVAACRSLTKADFELRFVRQPFADLGLRFARPSFADFELDPLESTPEATAQSPSEESATPAAAPATPSRLVALLFDWLGLGQQGTDEYSPRERAFTEARAYIEAHPLDRFVIAEIGDEANFRSTTFQSGPEAKVTLDRFKAGTDATGFLIRGQHLDMRGWRNAVLETVSRLGAMEPQETKDLFVMTTDVFPESDVFHDELRKLTTDNRVRVNTLDLAWDVRVLPEGLFAFSEAGGGVVFTDGATLTTAIQTLDRLRPCTFLITLKLRDNTRALPLTVTMKDPRLRVTAPEAVGGPFDVVAAEHAELKNDFENPATELGVRITPQLVRLSRRDRSAEYALTLLVEKTGDFDPEDVTTLRVYGAVWNKLKPRTAMYADFSAFRITEEGLRKIAGSGGEIFRFPDTLKIPNREKSVSVIVSVHGPRDSLSRVSASRRIEVPLPE
jgi:hypothetical protein